MTTDTGTRIKLWDWTSLGKPRNMFVFRDRLDITMRMYLEQSKYTRNKSLLGNSEYCYEKTNIGYRAYLIGYKNYSVYQSKIEQKGV
jgi:hypothetical protein